MDNKNYDSNNYEMQSHCYYNCNSQQGNNRDRNSLIHHRNDSCVTLNILVRFSIRHCKPIVHYNELVEFVPTGNQHNHN